MLKQGQLLSVDNLNRSYISKTATGTQIVLGSLNLSGSINASSFTGIHRGDGSGLTSLNASQITSGSISDARLSSNVFLLNKNQTVTSTTKFSGAVTMNAQLNFADGTTYYINNSGIASFNAATVHNTLTVNNLETVGEIKQSFENEFPDPVMASGSANLWWNSGGEIAFEPSQTPTEIAAFGAVKYTSAANSSYIMYRHYIDAVPNQWITLSMYLYATEGNTQGGIGLTWYNANKESLSSSIQDMSPIPTGWTRYSQTARAPATARYVRIRYNSSSANTSVYLTGFQVERGRALTGFKNYTGANQSEKNIGGVTISGVSLDPSTFGQGALNLWVDEGTDGRISSRGNYGIRLKRDTNEIQVGNNTSSVTMNGTVKVSGDFLVESPSASSTRFAGTGGTSHFNHGTAGNIYLSHGTGKIIYRTYNSTNQTYNEHSATDANGNWVFGGSTPTSGYRVDIVGKLRVTDHIVMNNKGIQKVNFLYFDYNGAYGGDAQHGITSKSTDSLWVNSFHNLTFNLDTNNNNSVSTFAIRKHAVDDTGPLLMSVSDEAIVVAHPITVPANMNSVMIDTNTGISLRTANNQTMFRNSSGLWSFQSNTGADSHDHTFSFYVPTLTTPNLNDNWFEMGQRRVNAGSSGSYKGVRIVKHAGSAVVDGDFQAGYGSFKGALDVTGSISTVAPILFNHTNRYILSTTTNDGLYWGRDGGVLELRSAGVAKISFGIASNFTNFHKGVNFNGDVAFNTSPNINDKDLIISPKTASARISTTFTGNTHKAKMNFMYTNTPVNYGHIIHEVAESKGVLHLAPYTKNDGAGYVSVHGTDETAEKLKLYTNGKVEAESYKVANKFSIEYNATENSLDFIYL